MFEWANFIEIAKFLQLTGRSAAIDPEAAYRSAISRAYYAAFCHARTYAVDKLGYIPLGNEEDHAKLRIFLSQKNLRPISSELDRLRQWRNKSDYDLPCYVASDSTTSSAISKAEKIVIDLPL
ncbi:MAG: hypothetical protein ACP5NU_03090 [Methanomicrobiales archaeon]